MPLTRLLLLGALALPACNLPGEPVLQPGDSEPPQLVETDPADGATGVSAELTFEARFSEPLDPRTIRDGFRLVQAAGSDPCASGTALPVCAFRPNAQELGSGALYTVRLVPGTEGQGADGGVVCERTTLARGALHAVCIGTTVTDAAGNPLAEARVITFTTAQQ